MIKILSKDGHTSVQIVTEGNGFPKDVISLMAECFTVIDAMKSSFSDIVDDDDKDAFDFGDFFESVFYDCADNRKFFKSDINEGNKKTVVSRTHDRAEADKVAKEFWASMEDDVDVKA